MKPIFNRAPLTPNALAPLPLGSIRPEGWLSEQLNTQAEAAKGRLDDLWPDDMKPATLCRLEGLVLLAWTLDDAALKALAVERMERLIDSQREDGWFGDEDDGDYWPLVAAMKALRQYFTATGDKRVLVLMDKFFKYQYLNLSDRPLRDWSVARGAENMELALWLYDLTGQKHLLELCRKLRNQTLDWPNYFHTFANTVPMSKSLKWGRLREALEEERNEPLEGEKRPYFRTQYHLSHGVNVAMGLKAPGVINLIKSGFKEQGGFRFGWEKLTRHHGLANGLFTCDEHLNGNSPTQGVETGAVTALMQSLETLIGLGDFAPEYADILEKVAYNALPAAFTPDMKGCQVCQQVNQVKVSEAPRRWYNDSETANLYGSEPYAPDYPADVQQGWPGFVASQWYMTADGGLQAISYAPCTVRATVGSVPVRVKVSGGYPFSQSAEIEVSVKQPCEFPIYLRVPFWARQPMIFLPDGEIMQVRSGETTCVRRRWRTGDVVRLELPTVPRVTKWYHQSGAVELGPLLMAWQPNEDWAQRPDGAWEVSTSDTWNWALVRDEPMKAVYDEVPGAFGVGGPPVSVLVKAVEVDWPMDGGSCASVPMVPKIDASKAQVIELVPYGGTALRVAQFPQGRAVEPEKK